MHLNTIFDVVASVNLEESWPWKILFNTKFYLKKYVFDLTVK